MFIIEHCFNCKEHAWCTRHDEKKYMNMALSVEKEIRAKIGGIKGTLNNSMLVQLNKFDQQLLIEEPTTLETTDGETFDFSPMT